MNGTLLLIASLLVLHGACPVSARQHAERNDDRDSARSMSEQAEAKAAREARRRGYRADPGGTYLDLMIPRPIEERQLERYALVLDLSAAQNQQFRRLYEAYREHDWSSRQDGVQPLWDQSAGLSSIDARSGPFSAESVEAKLALFEDRETVLRALIAGENRFFDSMIPFLSDEQIPRLEEVRRMRSRERSRRVATAYPGANLDLIELLYELQRDGYDLVPSDRQRYEEALSGYERELTHRLRRAADQRIDLFREELPIRRQIAEVVSTIDDRDKLREAVRPLHEARMAVYEDGVAADRNVFALNREFLPVLASLLPSETAAALEDAYRQSVFRPLYPDPYDATEVLEAARAEAGLTGEQPALLRTIEAEYASRRASIAERMERSYLRWREQFELRSGYNPDEYEGYQQKMQALQQQRQNAAHDALDALLELLDDQQFQHIASSIDACEQRAAEFEQRRAELARMGQVWPGPGQ